MTTVAQLKAVISLDDREFRQGIQRTERSFSQLGDAAKRAGHEMRSELDQALKSFDGRAALKGVTDAFTGLGSVAGSALQGVLGLFGKLGSVVVDVAGQIASTLTSALTGALTAAGALAATLGGGLAAALVALGKSGLEFNATMAQGNIGLTAVLGSAQAAAAGMEQFKKMADDSLLSLQDVTGQGTQLARAFGKEGWSQVLPSMKAFDAAAKVNQVSLQNVQNAMLQFRQLIQRDFAQQEELNGIGENLQINVAGYLRQAFGSADTEALKQAGISAKRVAKALVDGINAEMGPQAAALGRSLPIVLSGFGDTLGKIAGKATEAFGPRLTAALDSILTQFNRLGESGQLIRALEVPFSLAAKAIEAVGAALPNVVSWLEKIATQENVVNVLSQAAGWVQTLGQEVGRFIGVATGGKGLGGVFTSFQSVAEKAIDGVLRGWNVLVSSIRFLSDHAGEIWQLFADAMKPAQKALDALIGGVTMLAGGKLLGGAGSILGNLLGALGGGAKGGVGVNTGTPLPQPGTLPGGGFNPLSLLPYMTRTDFSGPEAAGRLVLEKLGLSKVGGGLGVSKAAGGAAGGIFDSLAGLGAQVRGEITKGLGDAAGALPDRLKNLWGGFQSQAQTAWNDGGLDALRRHQEENARRIQAQINGALAPAAPVAGSGIAPGHVMNQGGGAAVANAAVAALSDGKAEKKAEKEAAKLLGARQAAYDALLAQARAMSEVAGDGEKAQTEARIVIPALEAKLQELSRQAQQLLPKARTSADAAKDYWDTVKEGYSVQGQMNDLQQRAQQEQENALKKIQSQAKEALEKAKKAVSERLKSADLIVQLRESQIANIPGLNDRQRQQALVPALLQKYFAQNQAAAGAEGNDRLEQLIGANQTRTRVLEMAGIMSGGRLRVGMRQAQAAFAQLDEISARAAQSLPSARQAVGAPGGAAAAPSVKMTKNEINIRYDGNRPLTDADWKQFQRMYNQARQQESRDSGMVGPSGRF